MAPASRVVFSFSPLAPWATFIALLVLLGMPAWGAVPNEEIVPCPECAGTGKIPCPFHCDHGHIPCPDLCIKKSDPGWMPNMIQGRAAEFFPATADQANNADGMWFSTAHIGHLIVYEHGMPVDHGKCPTCRGTGFIDCPVCQGTDQVVCDLCHGTRLVPASVAKLYVDHHQDHDHPITLTTGVVRGEVVKVTIRTTDGMLKTVPLDSVVDRPGAFAFIAPLRISNPATASSVKDKPIN
jgi:hypothetical protein